MSYNKNEYLALIILRYSIWINFLSILPSTLVTVLVTTIAFLRFYDQSDFEFLGFITHPRIWSNRFTVAAILATLANFGVEWNRRNRETDRLAEEEQRRVEAEQRRVAQERTEENRRIEERERASRRARIETRCRIAQLRFQLEPSELHRQELINVLAVLEEYGNTF
jgi:signal transduction histidine kinase